MVIAPKFGQPKYLIVTVAAAVCIGYGISAVSLPLDVFTLGILIIAVSLIPIFTWIRTGSTSVPMYELVCLSYGLQYGVAVFAQPNWLIIQSRSIEISWGYVRKAQFVALSGIVAMMIGFSFGRVRTILAKIPRLDLPLESEQRLMLVVTCVALGIVAMILRYFEFSWLGGALGLLGALPLFGMAIMTLAICQKGSGTALGWERVALWILVGWLTVSGLASGMLEGAFMPLFIYYTLRTAKTRTFPVVVIVALFASMSVLNSNKGETRERMGETEHYSALGLGRAKVWTDILKTSNYSDILFGNPQTDKQAAWRNLLGRFSLLQRLGWVCMNTPAEVPYFYGASYKYFLYAPIPRLIWQNKPIASDATAMLDYAYLLRDFAQGDSYSIGIGFIAEAYANFAVPGVIVIMLLQGLFFAFLHNMFNSERSEAGSAIFVAITAGFINGIGTGTIILFGNIIQIAICCTVLVYIFSGRLRRFTVLFSPSTPPMAPHQKLDRRRIARGASPRP